MKIDKIILSLGFAALASLAAHAQSISTIGALSNENDGDLVLGFSNAGATNDLLVDVGPASDYYTPATALAATGSSGNGTLTPGTTYTVSAYNSADLSTALGGGNAVSSSTFWTVFGGNGTNTNMPVSTTPNQTLWLSAPSTTTVLRQTGALQTGPSQNLDGITNGLSGAGLASAESYIPGSKVFTQALTGANNFAFNSGGPVVGNTSATSSLTLYELLPTSSGTAAPIDLGTFTLSSSALTFTAYTAIPEPSTYAAILGALAIGFVMIRRRAGTASLGSVA